MKGVKLSADHWTVGVLMDLEALGGKQRIREDIELAPDASGSHDGKSRGRLVP